MNLLSPLGQLSGIDLIWTSLSGAYIVKGVYQGLLGAGTSRDLDGSKGLFRFQKRPIRRHFLGLGISGAVAIAVYDSYLFGVANFGWLQAMMDRVAIPGLVSTDQFSVLVASSLLFSHTLLRLYRSMYINVFADTTQDLMDYISPHIYSVLAGVTILTEAPALDGHGEWWISWSMFKWRHLAGLVLFVLATTQDNKLQYQLAKLRKNRAGHVVSEQHKLPAGGWFDRVTSPHFLTEILIHVAIGLTLGFDHKAWWLCTGYVTVSQTVRALGRQQWYKIKFSETFPKGRKAIFPYVL